MKFLLIGGAGYIGSHTAYELIKQNYNVVILDNLSTGNKDLIHKNAKFYLGNYHDKNLLDQIFQAEKIDVVMHFAASILVNESVQKPLIYYRNNTIGIINLLEAMNKNNIKQLIFSSTAAVYGQTPSQAPIKEEAIKNPINPYGWSKMFCEQIIKDYAKISRLKYGILRYFNVAGADSSGLIGIIPSNQKPLVHLIPVIADFVLNKQKKLFIFGNDFKTQDGTCIRDYIHVTDLSLAHIEVYKYIKTNQKSITVNVGSGIGYSNLEIIQTFEKILKQKIDFQYQPRREGDPPVLIASIDKIIKKIKFKNKYNLAEIIESEIKWRQKFKK